MTLCFYYQLSQDSDDLFVTDPLPQRPPYGDLSRGNVTLYNATMNETADRSAVYDDEELDNLAREQYESVSNYLPCLPTQSVAVVQSVHPYHP